MTQEGIANALKHAAGSAIRVEVEVTARSFASVETGAADWGARLANAGGGFGLAGLRERIRALGGTLEAQPTPAGGWRLAARLPSLAPRQDT